MQFDVSEMRRHFIENENLDCVDDVFTFYYDESNNIRKLHLTGKGLNVNKACNFVLAGILHRGERHNADFESLKTDLKLQKSVKEIKLKHIGKGSFELVLASEKLGILLQWLLDNDFYLHYFNLNVLYWSIVDIIDSIIEKLDSSNREFFIHNHMSVKSDLYKTIVNDQATFLDGLREFEYPNVKEDMVHEFTSFLINFVRSNSDVLDENRKYLLNEFMRGAIGAPELFFIMDEQEHVLISDFFIYYLRNTYLFKKSKHIFDDEKDIEAIFECYDLIDNGVVIKNYSFEDSRDFLEIQVSDVISGLLAKYFTFISKADKEEVKRVKTNLSQVQLRNLGIIEDLIDKSDAVSSGFCHRTVSEDEYLKSNYFIHNHGSI